MLQIWIFVIKFIVKVHRTRLKWREVVVKVQRPGLKALFDIDLKNLRLREGGRQEKAIAVFLEKIDYMKEGANADRFRTNFASLGRVKMPLPMMAVRDMCDPYLKLYRNILPPLMGVLDLSPMLAFLVLGILTSILNTSMA